MVHACAEGFHFLLVFLGSFLIILSNSFPASVCVCLFVCLSVFSPSRVSCLSSGVICCNTLSFCLSEGRSAGEKVFLLVRTRLHFPVILEVYFHQAQGFCWLRRLAAPFPPAAGVCRSPTARRAVPTSARPPRGAAGTRRLLLGEARGPRKAPGRASLARSPRVRAAS